MNKRTIIYFLGASLLVTASASCSRDRLLSGPSAMESDHVAFRISADSRPDTRCGLGDPLFSGSDGTVVDSLVFEAEGFDDTTGTPSTKGSLQVNMYNDIVFYEAGSVEPHGAKYDSRSDIYWSDPAMLYSDLSSSDIYCFGGTEDASGFAPVLDGSDLVFSYSTPTDVESQADIVFGSATGIAADRETALDVTFGHIFSGIRLRTNDLFPKVDGQETVIDRIVLKNVYLDGVFDPSDGSWTVDTGSKGDVTVLCSESSDDVSYDGNNKDVNDGTKTALLVPQTFADDAYVYVSCTVGGVAKTYNAALAGTMAQGTVYRISLGLQPDYLWFEALQAGSTVSMQAATNAQYQPDLYYSLDKKNWTKWDFSAITLSDVGDRVYLRGTKVNSFNSTSYNSSYHNKFVCTGQVSCGGDITTLISDRNLTNSCFAFLFNGCTALIDASELYLPSATLTAYCYYQMFYGCNKMISGPSMAPETVAYYSCCQMFYGCNSMTDISGISLPATTLAEYCYQNMFTNCSKITITPSMAPVNLARYCCTGMFNGCSELIDISGISLPATTLTDYCYSRMFSSCSKLTAALSIAPVNLAPYCCEAMFSNCTCLVDVSSINLPATKLANCCYYQMFASCSSLTDISSINLPATTLETRCYYGMFTNCKGITNLTGFSLPATTLADDCYTSMFSGCTNLTDASALDLPATKLELRCYYCMFSGCNKLTDAPSMSPTSVKIQCCGRMFQNCSSLVDVSGINLLAIILEKNCYNQMFYKCSSLTSAPTMAPDKVANSCCYAMFYDCSNLTDISAISLPATTLAEGCYHNMFYNCKKITAAPAMAPTTVAQYCCSGMYTNCSNLSDISAISLPATTLAESCYGAPKFRADNGILSFNGTGMFQNCTSLTTAPELPAETLVLGCYYRMFYGCSNLSYVKAMFTTQPNNYNTYEWLYGVSKSGTFVKNATATWNVLGGNGIPSNWTIQTTTE